MNLNQDNVSTVKFNSDNSVSSPALMRGAHKRGAQSTTKGLRMNEVQAQKGTTLENSFKVEFETFLQQSSFLPQKLVINLIKQPVNTAKSFNAMSKNKQYTFDVDPRLTKSQIKKLFEKLFAVNIVQIQTHIPPRKKITVGNVLGSSQKVKRVIFTLKEAQTIKFVA